MVDTEWYIGFHLFYGRETLACLLCFYSQERTCFKRLVVLEM